MLDMRFTLSLLLLIFPLTLHSIPYTQLLYQHNISTHIPQCTLIHQSINGVEEQFLILYINRFEQQILPPTYPQTQVFGFGCQAEDPITKEKLGLIYSSPGPTIRANSNMKLTIQYVNDIKGEHLFKIDKSLIMDPYKEINVSEIIGVPIVIHAHGMMVQSTSDGYPGAYVTSNGIQGPHYCSQRKVESNSFLYEYPLLEREATLWIHDHTIGITRLNVYAGLSAFLVIDPVGKTYLSQIPKKYDISLIFQDRSFKNTGELFYPSEWEPEYFGKSIVVNGKVWPVMNLKAHQYRLRLLNSCNARVLKLAFKESGKPMTFTIVKSDSSYLDKPTIAKQLLIFPGQRIEILLKMKKGEIELVNAANIPYPDGDEVDPETTGKVMKFVIVKPQSYKGLDLPSDYENKRESILEVDEVRHSVFIEEKSHHSDEGRSLIDGHDMNYPYPSFVNGKSYELNLINLTPDSHPFHIHLTQFQVIERRSFNSTTYQRDMLQLNGPAPWDKMTVIPLQKYLTNTTTYPAPHQRCLKDIVVVNPKQVIRVRFRFTMPDGQQYPFDVTKGPGYVWHCHILEHEDNSMMVAFKMENDKSSENLPLFIIIIVGGGALLIITVVGILYLFFSKQKGKLEDTIPLKVSNTSQIEIEGPIDTESRVENRGNREDFVGSPEQLNPTPSYLLPESTLQLEQLRSP